MRGPNVLSFMHQNIGTSHAFASQSSNHERSQCFEGSRAVLTQEQHKDPRGGHEVSGGSSKVSGAFGKQARLILETGSIAWRMSWVT